MIRVETLNPAVVSPLSQQLRLLRSSTPRCRTLPPRRRCVCAGACSPTTRWSTTISTTGRCWRTRRQTAPVHRKVNATTHTPADVGASFHNLCSLFQSATWKWRRPTAPWRTCCPTLSTSCGLLPPTPPASAQPARRPYTWQVINVSSGSGRTHLTSDSWSNCSVVLGCSLKITFRCVVVVVSSL